MNYLRYRINIIFELNIAEFHPKNKYFALFTRTIAPKTILVLYKKAVNKLFSQVILHLTNF